MTTDWDYPGLGPTNTSQRSDEEEAATERRTSHRRGRQSIEEAFQSQMRKVSNAEGQ